MNIENNCVIAFHYKLTDDEGTEIDTTAGGDPHMYLHGSGGIIPGLENALLGKVAGDQLQVTVQPEEGYGKINPEMVQLVPLSAFEGVEDVQSGMTFEATGPEGQVQVVTVQKVSDEGITINANHPLAGKVLHFDVTIEVVREATKEELDHGHAH